MIDIRKILEILPHRYPILLVDKVEELKKGESIVAIKNVTFNEPHFNGHFPNHPVMPGVLMIEALAQASAILVAETLEGEINGRLVYFTSIDGAKFRRPVVPGDVLKLHSTITKNKRNLWKFKVQAEVDGEKAVEAEIAAMIMDQ